jgi:Uma2 family endonuclease
MNRDRARQTITAEHFQRLPDEPGYRLELVRGMVVRSPGPGARHGKVDGNVVSILVPFVRRQRLGDVFSGGTSYILERRPDTVRGPDISFVSRDRLPQDRLPDSYLEQAPDLAIEILSPSNRPGQLRQRMTDLFRGGCREVWVLDPTRETVTIHRPEAMETVLEANSELESPLLPGFRVRVTEFFRSD